MKRMIQQTIKYFLDFLVFPLLITCAVLARFFSQNDNRVLFGLMANNNLIYVKDSLVKFGYKASVIPWIIPEHERNHIKYDLDLKTSFPILYNNFFGQIGLIYFFFIWAVFKFDIFILPFQNRLLDRTGFLRWFEFQLLHLAGKKIILNPYGGDIQYVEVWENSKNKTFQELHKAWKSDPYYCYHASKKMILKNTKYCQNHADLIVLSIDWPDYLIDDAGKQNLIHFHMRSIPRQKARRAQKNPQALFKIVHATNHPQFKGTKFLEKAVSEINAKKTRCELVILQNTGNAKVLEEIQKADVVFDQILLGAYGRLAIEAMSLGTPVICYLRDDLKELYPSWKECPIINANIDSLKDKILEIMDMTDEQKAEIGTQSMSYVEKYHSPEYVGEKLHTIIQEVLST
jgi:glycosyltransferase involved in cell wall biosynthesis